MNPLKSSLKIMAPLLSLFEYSLRRVYLSSLWSPSLKRCLWTTSVCSLTVMIQTLRVQSSESSSPSTSKSTDAKLLDTFVFWPMASSTVFSGILWLHFEVHRCRHSFWKRLSANQQSWLSGFEYRLRRNLPPLRLRSPPMRRLRGSVTSSSVFGNTCLHFEGLRCCISDQSCLFSDNNSSNSFLVPHSSSLLVWGLFASLTIKESLLYFSIRISSPGEREREKGEVHHLLVSLNSQEHTVNLPPVL